MKATTTLLAVGFSLLFCFLVGYRIVAGIQWERGVDGRIKRAADANTVELARNELVSVVSYLDANHIQGGYTSVIYTTPDEDVGFWYNNLTASLHQLQSISPDATQGDKDLVLMKLRQTLLDHTKEGEKVTSPPGISVFPHNTELAVVTWLSLFLALVLGSLAWAFVSTPQTLLDYYLSRKAK